MKKMIGLLCLAFTLNSQAIESSVFKDYPGFQNYQLILFSQLVTYFDTFAKKSMINIDSNGIRIFKFRSGLTVFAKIDRALVSDQILERVTYYLENGSSLVYELKRQGSNISPSKDEDLLSFHFHFSQNENLYQITIPTFNIQMTDTVLSRFETSFFSLGFMDSNIQIETHFYDHEANLNYIYFSKGKPNPQTTLTVKAIENNQDWGGTQFRYISSSAGEISPRQFFQGLNDDANFFTAASTGILNKLMAAGFPNLN